MEADYKSIQEAINNAASGDTILVSPSEYVENVNVNKELTIISKSGNPENTVIRAASTKDDVFDINANNVTISGFKITGAKTDEYGQDKAGIYFEGGYGLSIKNNTITRNNEGIFLMDS
jgi:nitrous oxidase accessory protein NosD